MISAGYLIKNVTYEEKKTLLSLTYIVSFGLEHVEHQSDAILNGRHQLPHAVLVGRVFLGPPGGGEGAIQLGNEPTTGSCWWERALILVVEVWEKNTCRTYIMTPCA